MATLVDRQIAVFDDSFQPTGTIHWRNDGPFGLPNPHVEMKKLRHELHLTIDGPNDLSGAVQQCLQQSLIAGLITGLAAAFLGAGLGATGPAWNAFQAAFINCAGHQVTTRIDDKSHWISWDT